MGYQSCGAPYGLLEASKYNLTRFAAPVATGQCAENVVTQIATVGFCRCCGKAAHIAISASFKLGEYSPLKELGMHLEADEGPRAGRRTAAVDYVRGSYGSPPPGGSGRAAKSLEFVAPNLWRACTYSHFSGGWEIAEAPRQG